MLAVIMVKFSSSKVGIVHKYHNHGHNRPGYHLNQTSLAGTYRQYSTSSKAPEPILLESGPVTPTNHVVVPWVETTAIASSRAVLKQMLSYLEAKNSPLHPFLTSHPRFLQLSAVSPYPTITLPLVGSSVAAAFSFFVKAVMPTNILAFSSVYVIGHSSRMEFYVGSRIAGSNRASTHRAQYRDSLRSKLSLSLLHTFVRAMGGFSKILMGTLLLEPSITQKFRLSHSGYVLNLNELEILQYFERWLIRVQEQAIISYLNPQLNKDSVKFQLNWEPKSDDYNPTASIYVYGATDSSTPLISSTRQMELAATLGLKYKLFKRYLDTTGSVYSPTLEQIITIRREGATLLAPVNLSYVTTEPIIGFDLLSLAPGIHAYLPNKLTLFRIFDSVAQAAWLLDRKIEIKYIERYINVEFLVKTAAGLLYFVKHPDYVAPCNVAVLGGLKGMKSAIVMFDPIHQVYVLFKSKAAASMFIWEAPNRSQAFDRYLAHVEGRTPLAFKGVLLFYYPVNVPDGVSLMPMEEYYTLIGSRHYEHKL